MAKEGDWWMGLRGRKMKDNTRIGCFLSAAITVDTADDDDGLFVFCYLSQRTSEGSYE